MASYKAPPLTANEALSGAFGSISLASWIFLLVPQLVENYKQGSADGISTTFLLVWFLGDITNLAGALWASLVPTVVALAVYFCIADLILILQCSYYNSINRARKAKESSVVADPVAVASPSDERSPLLVRSVSRELDNTGLPGSHRRRSSAASRRHRESVNRQDSLASIVEENAGKHQWLKNVLSVLGISAIGAVGWAIAWQTGVWTPVPVGDGQAIEESPLGAQILGYASAVCYLGARIPQIIKNQRDKSCEGLSLLFFILSLLGNATYGAGILFHSLERQYIMTNLPWLIGSLGTMVEDATIFMQFRIYGEATVEESDA